MAGLLPSVLLPSFKMSLTLLLTLCTQVKYILGVSYKKQDTLQGELSNIILQLQKGQFKWQEFVMGMAMLGFLISLKLIQKK